VELRERIVKSAEERFMRYGIKSITMDDIARDLGISKKTIYQFFTEKGELVSMVMKNHIHAQQIILENIRKSAVDPIDEVLKISDYLKSSLQNTNIIVLFEVQKYHPQCYKLFLDYKEECIHTMLMQNMERGKELGLYRAEINVEIIAKLRTEEITIGFNPALFPPDKFTAQGVQVEFLDHFLHGICTLKGHKLINKYKQIVED
jgi:AcrR family transcriptional regulator